MKKDLKIRIGLSVALIICTVLFINEIISHEEKNRSLYTITFEGNTYHTKHIELIPNGIRFKDDYNENNYEVYGSYIIIKPKVTK